MANELVKLQRIYADIGNILRKPLKTGYIGVLPPSKREGAKNAALLKVVHDLAQKELEEFERDLPEWKQATKGEKPIFKEQLKQEYMMLLSTRDTCKSLLFALEMTENPEVFAATPMEAHTAHLKNLTASPENLAKTMHWIKQKANAQDIGSLLIEACDLDDEEGKKTHQAEMSRQRLDQLSLGLKEIGSNLKRGFHQSASYVSL